MDPILAALPEALLTFVEDQLSNNDVSSDEELQEHLVASGLSEEQAHHALTYRDRYRRDIYLQGFTPIRTPDAALRFNPHTRAFEPDS